MPDASATATPEQSTKAPAEGGRLLLTISLMAATFMQALDTTIANVALPHMEGSLSATQDQITWILTSYIVAAAIMTPLTGWLAGRFGRKRVILISISGFVVASALCGIATSLSQMVVYRLLQGLSGAALVPISQAVLLDTYPTNKHGQAMAMWGLGVTLAPVVGPVLGGWLTEDYSWRWVFYINVPIGILAFFGLLTSVKDSPRVRRAFDFFGFGALSVGVGALQMMLDRGEIKDWFGSTEVVLEGFLAALGFYFFVVRMVTAKRPFLSLALFKDRNFVTGNVFIFVVGIILFATLVLIPPLFQQLMNYPVVTTGLIMAPRGVGTMLSMVLVGRVAGKIDPRILIAFGFGLSALSLWQMMGFDLQMDRWPVIWSGLIQGFGVGFAYVSLTTVSFATLPQQYRAEGTAFFNLMRNIGSSIGISAVQALLTENTQIMHSSLAQHISPFNSALHNFNLHSTAALAQLNGMVTSQAAMIAYNDDFKVMMILSLLTIPFLLFLRVRKPRPGEKPEMVAME
ncbi:MAG TPA: DHA2 family efflux MFS transporter permease subunit [Stellaceae bacterium]|jgi:DHA2 family multidrug resistance protein|nr:DHA2 family efflux MFS transporter permease subunit [Stellaceae bacterium]